MCDLRVSLCDWGVVCDGLGCVTGGSRLGAGVCDWLGCDWGSECVVARRGWLGCVIGGARMHDWGARLYWGPGQNA